MLDIDNVLKNNGDLDMVVIILIICTIETSSLAKRDENGICSVFFNLMWLQNIEILRSKSIEKKL